MSQDFSRYENPPIPFASEIHDSIFPGKALLVKGIVLANKNKIDRFSIDLCCGQLVHGDHQDDKALHFNSRFDNNGNWFSKADRDIVLNSLINNSWGPEQRCSNVLTEGKSFSIRILILKDYFKIAINGVHLCDYIHRISIDLIKFLYINGCVELNLIEFQGSNPASILPTAPPSNSLNFEPIVVTKPNIPFVQDIGFGGFVPPRELQIIFTPRMSAECFSINFFVGTEYLLHIRVDFPSKTKDKGAIVRNSTKKGKWMTEERHLSKFPLYPGITSDIRIIANNESAKISIDGVVIDNFTYREFDGCPKPSQLDRLTIIGDLIIQKFEYNNVKN